ncbi:MAG: methyl-accepting chemotaxis protein [Rhodocyclaceae bacterium]
MRARFNVRIGHRLAMGFGLVVLILMALAANLYVLLGGIKEGAAFLRDGYVPQAEATMRLSQGVTRILLAASELPSEARATALAANRQTIEATDEEVREIMGLIEALQARFVAGEDERRHFGLFRSQYALALASVAEAADMLGDPNSRAVARLMFDTDVAPSLKVAQRALDGYLSVAGEYGREQVVGIDASAERALSVLIGATIAAVLASVLVGWVVTRSIVGRMSRLTAIAECVAAGDLRIDAPLQGRDEIASLAAEMGRMAQALTRVIAEIQRSAQRFGEAAHCLSESASQVDRGCVEQAEASAGIAAALEEITASIGQVSELAGDARKLSLDSGARAEDGAHAMGAVAHSVESMADAVRRTTDETNALDVSIAQIAGIVGVIRDVADQTNLLALNAAIEAARAGEHGRGFAVVADEVRKLAEKTSRSALDISGLVESIRAGSSAMATRMLDTVDAVERGTEQARTATEVVQAAQVVSGELVGLIDGVDLRLREQAEAAGDVSRRVELVVLLAEANSGAVTEVAKAAEDLLRLADTLSGCVAHFQVAR